MLARRRAVSRPAHGQTPHGVFVELCKRGARTTHGRKEESQADFLTNFL